MAKNLRGFTDQAAREDVFAIEKYINGLTTFIKTCNTPMTISVQGTWGTGKTSLMQIVNQKLGGDKERPVDSNTKCCWFNTWQFSQFNMDNELAVSLLTCLIDELQLPKEQEEKVKGMARAIKLAQAGVNISKDIFLSYIDSKVGGRAADTVEDLFNRAKDVLGGTSDESDMSPAVAIKKLKEQFAACVAQTLAATGKDRIVVFIDDLDRLEPRKAVELLEVLKLFLDCENCVFVLAIDYAVVCRGVEAKYGKLSDDESENKEKGKSFFDKIIQVPFKMPVAEYDISNYVKSCFQEIGIPCAKDEVSTYVDLIKTSCGTNPRSMKRLFNTYLLLTIVVDKEVLEKDRNKQLLFAVLCLQYSFEQVYIALVGNAKSITEETFRLLASGDSADINKSEELEGIDLSEMDALRLKPFMECFLNVVASIDGDEQTISVEEMANVRSVLGVSTITAAGESSVATNRVVDSVNELDLKGTDPQKLTELIDQIEAACPGCSYKLLKNKYSNVPFRAPNNKKFVDIYMRSGWFAVDCLARDASVYKREYIANILKKYIKKGKSSVINNERIATIPVKDETSLQDLLIVAKASYDSHQEK